MVTINVGREEARYFAVVARWGSLNNVPNWAIRWVQGKHSTHMPQGAVRDHHLRVVEELGAAATGIETTMLRLADIQRDNRQRAACDAALKAREAHIAKEAQPTVWARLLAPILDS